MSELERRLRTAARAHAASATDARAPRTVRRSIGRRRALLPGTLGVVGAVIIASLAAGGLGLTDPTDPPSPSPTPNLSIGQGSRALATVPLPEASYDYEMTHVVRDRLCGNPAPQPSADSKHLTGVFDVPDHLNLRLDRGATSSPDSRANLTLTYDADDVLPAFAGSITALLLDDGIVVAFADNYRDTPINSFKKDQNREFPWSWGGWLESCADDGAGPLPPAGDYEVVFISQVHNDLAAAARWSLAMDEYMLPAAQDLETFSQGSYLCDRWRSYLNYQPITCSPHAVVGLEIDPEAGMATVPYTTKYYVRDVDVTFVSDPVPTTLSGELGGGMQDLDIPRYDPDVEPMCGDSYGHVDTGEVAGTWKQQTTTVEPGDTIVPTLWLWSLGWSTAEVTVPQSPRVWILNSTEIATATEADTSTYYYGHQVVGWVDTESAQSVVEITAYEGPRVWPLRVTDVQWCEGMERSLDQVEFGHFGLSGLVANPFTVTLNDGTSRQADAITLNHDGLY